MYKIIGSDQKEYGSVTADQIRQWITQGRVHARTQIQAEGGTRWQVLEDFPEFAELLATRVSAAPGGSPPLPPLARVAPAQTSRLAITSLVLGVLGFLTLGLTALVGLVLGIVARVRISNSQGHLGGSGAATAGIVVSAVALLLVPVIAILAAMLLPALAQAKSRAQTIVCVNNVKQLGLAVRLYATDHQDQFPPAATWCDAIQSYVGAAGVFKCPAGDPVKQSHYAFNAQLDGRDTSKVAPETVMIFEADDGWNVSGGPDRRLGRSRHGGLFVVALADGSVQQVSPARLKELRWEP